MDMRVESRVLTNTTCENALGTTSPLEITSQQTVESFYSCGIRRLLVSSQSNDICRGRIGSEYSKRNMFYHCAKSMES